MTAAGSPPLIYQWRKNGVDIIGATQTTYTTPATTLEDNGTRLSVTVGNSIGEETSSSGVLTVVSKSP